ncbi:MAG: hypothetical protein ACREH6_06890, partial [Geminicoccaceae bacterium]
MTRGRPVLDQLNVVSGNLAASIEFYRRLGVDIPEEAVWRTRTGIHDASAKAAAGEDTFDLDLDSTEFAKCGTRDGAGAVILEAASSSGFACRRVTPTMRCMRIWRVPAMRDCSRPTM